MLYGHLASAIKTFVQLWLNITKLRDIKVQKIDQILHANMEGFRRASHICNVQDMHDTELTIAYKR